ncbi:MAG: type II toxin-antitoxin system CcdA family antitoxin [Gammaproteobacteria bacterium]|nr:type II toxin-antitoxin system CcdA family antitoxin [Gammaproteobacteria bacterium]
MQRIYDETAPKKSANLSINSDLLKKARGLNINLSATLEQALTQQVKKVARETWLKENKQALNSLNDLAEENGLFSDSYRNF